MKIDNKVKDGFKIFTCFDTELAKQYVDSKGYFTNDMGDFNNLDDCYYGTLNVADDLLIKTIKEKLRGCDNVLTDYSQECEGTFEIKDGNVTNIHLTGIALIPRSKDGVEE